MEWKYQGVMLIMGLIALVVFIAFTAPPFRNSDAVADACDAIQELLKSSSDKEMQKSIEEIVTLGGLKSKVVRSLVLSYLNRLGNRTVEQAKLVIAVANMEPYWGNNMWMHLLTVRDASVMFEILHILPTESDIVSGLIQGPISELVFGHPLLMVTMDGKRPVELISLLCDYAQLWWIIVTDKCSPHTPLIAIKCKEKSPSTRFPFVSRDSESVKRLRRQGWGGFTLEFSISEFEKNLLRRARQEWNLYYYSHWKFVNGFPISCVTRHGM